MLGMSDEPVAKRLKRQPMSGAYQGATRMDVESAANQDPVPAPNEDPLPASAESSLLGSELFDPAYYAQQCSLPDASATELAAHYLAIGEPQGLPPSDKFDPKFYLATNADVKSSGASPLLHYIRHGAAEARYPTRGRLRADALYIEQSGLFDARAFTRNRTRPATPGLTPGEDYLLGRDQVSIGDGFDNAAYTRWYEGDLAGYAVPLLHYLDIGLAQARVATVEELGHRRHVIAPTFNARHYLGQLPDAAISGQAVGDPVEHYILYGSRLELEPEPGFSPDYYIRRYPDLQGVGLDVYSHYVGFGLKEGRIGRPDFLDITAQGQLAFDADKPTILIANHEASRTGAPLVGLNVGARLSATHNVIFYLGRSGSLAEEFKANCCLVITGSLDPLHAEFLLVALKQSHLLGAVLLNSVETSPLARAALYAGLPSVGLIHEFAEYTLPIGRMSGVIEAVDRIIVPAELIRQSMLAELATTRAGSAQNIRVRPQGCLPELPKDAAEPDMTREEILAFIGAPQDGTLRLVLGAGYAQMRKGVDLFVQTAAEVRRLCGDDVRFIWVGDGYNPTRDLAYSAWVGDMVRRLDLERTVFFLPPQSSLGLLFEMSSVFFLSSRLDPFPNVVLDALRAGRAVVCFEGATGVASLFGGAGGPVGTAAPYCSVPKAAKALAAAMVPEARERALANTAIAAAAFSFDDYIGDLTSELEAARQSHGATMREVARLRDSGLFDAGFFERTPGQFGPAHMRRALIDYAAQGLKGLMQFNPRPGFNEGLARGTGGQDRALGPALGRPGVPTATHRCFVLGESPPGKPFPGRVALHLHLHYPELAGAFLDDLVEAKSTADLFVTTTSDEKSLEIAYALRKYRGGRVVMTVAPNRGRDIGPFLTQVGQHVRGGEYDVVGHLHGKRSLSTDPEMGNRWRDFLVKTLLGGQSGMAGVLAPFARDRSLGLLFAEDRHVVGWSGNRAIAAELAARMRPQPTLPEWPVFPIGTMFWARPAALEPLWQLGLEVADFPYEPTPYDGTVLHALERLLPSVCEAAGMSWATVHRSGSGW